MQLPKELINHPRIFISQKHEVFELLGYETRNRYSIQTENKTEVGYAAEQQKGILAFFMRQYLGHWRKFDILFFSLQRQMILKAHHPFRWLFQRLDIYDPQNILVGSIQQRFGILKKSFDVLDANGRELLTIRSGFFNFWTFNFKRRELEVASVRKKWSGGFSEIFTDRDNFMVEFKHASLSEQEKTLILSAAMFVDLIYFEKKG
jgi:uncharacterized protein YxjI